MTYQLNHTILATYTVPETGMPADAIAHLVSTARSFNRVADRLGEEGVLYISINNPKCSLKGFHAIQREKYEKLGPGSEIEIRSTRPADRLSTLVEALRKGLQNDAKKIA